MTTLDRTLIIDALYDADLNEDDLRENYSGRGMYGAECFGIVGSPGDASRFLIHIGQHDTELAEKLANNQRSDSMGRSGIYYFPSYAIEEES